MTAKITNKAKAEFIQYSKKMCTIVTVFWMIYRLINFIVVLLNPDISAALVDLCAGVDTIMIVNMSAYTLNSSTEKVAIAYTRRKTLYDKNSDNDNEDDEDEDEDEDSCG